jgi:sugar (pentulose or hexulose) kinase
MLLNTLYQLASLVRDRSPLLEIAQSFLTLPDLFNYWLTGTKAGEFTIATTTQLYNPRSNDWDGDILDAIGVPTHIFPAIVPSGTRLGEFQGVPVIAPATHDTGSAVIAVPTTTRNYAYLSSGTWSLLGLELDEPVINDGTYAANLTNEGGVGGKYRFLRNVVGMWLVQQCRAVWRSEGTEYSYDQLAELAIDAPPFQSLIDPDDHQFVPPGDMPARIREFCRKTGQTVPETHGQFLRTIYESLALKYRDVLDRLIALSGQTVERLHVIGGGSQNRLLNQMTADALGRQVVAGPVEATVIGNAIVQLIALGEIAGVEEARDMLRRSVETQVYEPKHRSAWEEAYERFKDVKTTI